MNPEWRSRYEVAVEAAQKAGQLALRYFDTDVTVEWKQDKSPVTVADREAEALLRKTLLGAFPGDGFLGEESGDTPGPSGFRWIIDPIDGTRSFVRGVPLWATLVGLEYRGEQIAGVAVVPALGQTYRALRGDGAYRDARRIRVSDVATLAEAHLFYSSINWFIKANALDAFLQLGSQTQRQRGFGDFYGFVLVAQGSGEVMFEHGCHAWDLAALQVIVEEAGGRMTAWDGKPDIFRPDVIASNGKLHDTVLAILQKKERHTSTGAATMNNAPSERSVPMSLPEANKPVVIETEYGPRIADSRITIYDVFYYMLKGWHHSSIGGMLRLSSAQVLAVMKYIEEHRAEVEEVHRQIEERNARGNPPEVQAKLDAIHAKYAPIWAERRRALGLEDGDEGDPG